MSADEEILQSPADEFHLACLLLSPTGVAYLGETLEAVAPGDFFDAHYGRLWEIARKLHGADQRVTKRALLAEADNPAARARLERISGEPVYTGRIADSARAVVDAAKLRRLVQHLDNARSHALTTAGGYSEALSVAHELLGKLDGSDMPAEVVPFSKLVDEFTKWQAGGLQGGEIIPTPWPELNDLLSGGFHPGRSFVIAGRLGEGKSIAGLNAAQYAAEQGFSTLVVSAEMSGLELTGRIMASGAAVEYGEITRLSMSPDTHHRVTEYGVTNRDMPLWVLDKPGLTIEYIAAVARTMKRRQGLDVLVIDYVQLLRPSDTKASREQQVAHIANAIKELARSLECVIITLAQLNRDNVKGHRRPTAADLRESDAIGQAADSVILLYHELTPDGDPTGMVTLIVDKNRFGKKSEVQLRWRGHQARIGDSWAA